MILLRWNTCGRPCGCMTRYNVTMFESLSYEKIRFLNVKIVQGNYTRFGFCIPKISCTTIMTSQNYYNVLWSYPLLNKTEQLKVSNNDLLVLEMHSQVISLHCSLICLWLSMLMLKFQFNNPALGRKIDAWNTYITCTVLEHSLVRFIPIGQSSLLLDYTHAIQTVT